MAFSPSYLPTQTLFSVVFVIFTTFILLLASEGKAQHTDYLFDINNFTKLDPTKFTLQGSARILRDGVLSLTDEPKKVGRILYSDPIQIWNKYTGAVANFETTISFVIKNDTGADFPADGLIFFLAPKKQVENIGNKTYIGGLLGIVDLHTALNQFVGVEFDNFVNDWDHNYSHVGIDVNSLTSLATKPWTTNNGSLHEVRIVYDAATRTLSATSIDDRNEFFFVDQVINLKDVLPDTITIGISAAIDEGRQLHHIHSWRFHSRFESTPNINNNNHLVSYA
ncbi:unnamed protein product [Trifolium pratense]|uniref:Uncharacterized protein n=1 Tax=Trifolium pratense TaxID=57577 RepID=A0ACB0KBB1_TRIPR|nr:unnamed protein product [Trifolium pratense]